MRKQDVAGVSVTSTQQDGKGDDDPDKEGADQGGGKVARAREFGGHIARASPTGSLQNRSPPVRRRTGVSYAEAV
ncbi:hypothetical protein Ancab_023691 [Ancistrocladus abbreviatus]